MYNQRLLKDPPFQENSVTTLPPILETDTDWIREEVGNIPLTTRAAIIRCKTGISLTL